MKIFRNGFLTGLILQLAVGPVFFFIMNLTLQRTVLDGLAGAAAITIVDYFYIALAILGAGKLLENPRFKKVFGIVSSVILAIFGIIIIQGITSECVSEAAAAAKSMNLFSSFSSVFVLTISSPMTIIFFTTIFAAKAVEYNYTKQELLIFGLGTGFATLLFVGTSVILFSLLRGAAPVLLIQLLNLIVGALLVGYGAVRFAVILKEGAGSLIKSEQSRSAQRN